MLPAALRRDILRNAKRRSLFSNSNFICHRSLQVFTKHPVPLLAKSNLDFDTRKISNDFDKRPWHQPVRFKSALVSCEQDEEEVAEFEALVHKLDKPSLYLISLLEDVLLGRDTGLESVTTERCNTVSMKNVFSIYWVFLFYLN